MKYDRFTQVGYEGRNGGTLLETYQFSVVPPYLATLGAGNFTTLTHKLGSYGSFAGGARWNAARLSLVWRSDL